LKIDAREALDDSKGFTGNNTDKHDFFLHQQWHNKPPISKICITFTDFFIFINFLQDIAAQIHLAGLVF
jgi:hypothetical protein